MTKVFLLIYVIVMVAVAIDMLRNGGPGDNRLFWKTFGIITLMLAGLVAYIAICEVS